MLLLEREVTPNYKRMSYNNSSTLPCYNFSKGQYIGIITTRTITATISFLACLFVIGIIVLFKKYLFQTQRLILYLDIAVLTHSLSQAIDNISYKDVHSLHYYCIATGFLNLYTGLSVAIAIACFTIDIFIQATCKRTTNKIEAFYVVVIFISPLMITWIPFPFKAYGYAGGWCWIKEYKDLTTCTIHYEGIALQFCLYYFPLFILYPVLFILLVITLVYLYKRRYTYEASVDPQAPNRRTALRSEIKSLLPYPCIIMVISIIPLVTRIYRATSSNDPFALWITDSFFTSITGAVIAVMFTIDPETRHRLRLVHIRASVKELFTKRIQEYPITESSDEFIDSRRVTDSMETSVLLTEEQFESIHYQEMTD